MPTPGKKVAPPPPRAKAPEGKTKGPAKPIVPKVAGPPMNATGRIVRFDLELLRLFGYEEDSFHELATDMVYLGVKMSEADRLLLLSVLEKLHEGQTFA